MPSEEGAAIWVGGAAAAFLVALPPPFEANDRTDEEEP